MTLNRFDVHAHYLPPGSISRGAPGQNFVASPMPTWAPEFALDFMDQHDIATQLLSLPTALSKSDAHNINTARPWSSSIQPALACWHHCPWMMLKLRCPG